jgi:hypothetical protein
MWRAAKAASYFFLASPESFLEKTSEALFNAGLRAQLPKANAPKV